MEDVYRQPAPRALELAAERASAPPRRAPPRSRSADDGEILAFVHEDAAADAPVDPRARLEAVAGAAAGVLAAILTCLALLD